jgi:hypothetical protein
MIFAVLIGHPGVVGDYIVPPSQIGPFLFRGLFEDVDEEKFRMMLGKQNTLLVAVLI